MIFIIFFLKKELYIIYKKFLNYIEYYVVKCFKIINLLRFGFILILDKIEI